MPAETFGVLVGLAIIKTLGGGRVAWDLRVYSTTIHLWAFKERSSIFVEYCLPNSHNSKNIIIKLKYIIFLLYEKNVNSIF